MPVFFAKNVFWEANALCSPLSSKKVGEAFEKQTILGLFPSA
jgi:hypothetical protein